MPTSRKSFPVLDVDSHVLEPAAVWTEYLEPEYRVPARSAFCYEHDENGLTAVILNGETAPAMQRNGINRMAVYRPGMTPQDIGRLDPRKAHPANPGAQDPAARLRDMDAMGVDKALLLPTLFSEYFPVIQNPDAAAALARAYNNWIRDFASAAPDRLYPAAVLPMQSPSFALREAQRAAGMGFKAAVVRPSFHQRRLPSHSSYDAFWAGIEKLGLAVCVHPSSGSTNPEWTSQGPFIERTASALHAGHPMADTVAPAMDSGMLLSAFCFMGHMETYPKLKLSYLHSGAYWVPLALEKSETYLWLSPQMLRPVSLEPERVFAEHPNLVSFDSWESCVPRLLDIYGRVAAWASRYPHHDASDAWEAIDNLERWGVPGDVVPALMGGNAARFYGIALG